MGFIKDAVLSASNALGCSVAQLNSEETATVRVCIERKYSHGNGGSPLWERLSGDCSSYEPDGWRAISEFPFFSRVTMFFDRDDEATMFSIATGNDVVRILSECPGFVFYLTDDKFSLLLCHNDHDYLIGAGAAAYWVGNRENR